MFDFLEELATFYGYVTDNQYLKCKSCGFLIDKSKASQIIECPKSGENEWEETSLLEGGGI